MDVSINITVPCFAELVSQIDSLDHKFKYWAVSESARKITEITAKKATESLREIEEIIKDESR